MEALDSMALFAASLGAYATSSMQGEDTLDVL